MVMTSRLQVHSFCPSHFKNEALPSHHLSAAVHFCISLCVIDGHQLIVDNRPWFYLRFHSLPTPLYKSVCSHKTRRWRCVESHNVHKEVPGVSNGQPEGLPGGSEVAMLAPRWRGSNRKVVLGVNLEVRVSRGARQPTGGAVIPEKLLLHLLLLS